MSGDKPCSDCGSRAPLGLVGVSEDEARQFAQDINALAVNVIAVRAGFDEMRARGQEVPEDLRLAYVDMKGHLGNLLNSACGTNVAGMRTSAGGAQTSFRISLPRSAWGGEHPCVEMISDEEFVRRFVPDSALAGSELALLPALAPAATVGITIVVVTGLAFIASALTAADVANARAARVHAETVQKAVDARIAGNLSQSDLVAVVDKANEAAKASGLDQPRGNLLDSLMDNLTAIGLVVGGVAAAVILGPPVFRWLQAKASGRAVAGLSGTAQPFAFEFWDGGGK